MEQGSDVADERNMKKNAATADPQNAKEEFKQKESVAAAGDWKPFSLPVSSALQLHKRMQVPKSMGILVLPPPKRTKIQGKLCGKWT